MRNCGNPIPKRVRDGMAVLIGGLSIDYWAAWGVGRIGESVGLGLFWVCFFGVGGWLFFCNSFWGKGLRLFWGFGDWVCFA